MEPARGNLQVTNKAGESVFVTLGRPSSQREHESRYPIDEELEAGRSASMTPHPVRAWGDREAGVCLTEPLIARDREGHEVARLEEGVCWEEMAEWIIGED